jgi:adenylate cyclase
MRPKIVNEAILNSPLFQGLNPDLIEEIGRSAIPRTYEKGVVIYQKGDPAGALFVLLSGSVVLETSTEDGKELRLRTINAGEVFGEVGVLDFGPRQESARTSEKSELLRIDRQRFMAILQTSHELCFRVFTLLCGQVRGTTEDLEDTVFYSLRRRLARRLIILSADLDVPDETALRITQAELAGMLGVNRQAVNKHLRELENQRLIELGRRRIKIHDLPGLAKLASPLRPDAPGPTAYPRSLDLSPIGFGSSQPGASVFSEGNNRTAGLLAVNAVEYSRALLMDVAKTLKRVNKGFDAVEKAIRDHHGLTVWQLGDRMLAEFPDAECAMQAALAIQEHTGPAGTQKKHSLFRIGVHVGDLETRESSIRGNEINTTIRLAELSRPGGIAVSGAVRDTLDDEIRFDWKYLGEHELKNVAGSVRVYSLQAVPVFRMLALWAETMIPRRYRPVAAMTAALALAAALWSAGDWAARLRPQDQSTMPSIAVLPFQSDGSDGFGPLAQGIPREVRANLARFAGLRVIGPQTSDLVHSNLASTDLVSKMMDELQVSFILAGEIRSEHDRIWVESELRQAGDGAVIWSRAFDGTEYNAIEINGEISAAVLGSLGIDLPDDRPLQMATSPEAYSLYLKGEYLHNRRDRESRKKAQAAFQKAVDIDPGFAPAWLGLARAYSGGGIFNQLPRAERHQSALDAISRALAAENTPAAAWCYAGWLKIKYEWDWEGAEAAFNRAMKLNPSDGQCIGARATLAWTLAQNTKEMRLREARVELDPLYLAGLSALGQTYIRNKRPGEAMAQFQRIFEIHPEFPFIEEKIGRAYLLQGDAAKALDLFSKFRPLRFNALQTASALAALGRNAEAQAVILEYIEKHAELSPFWTAAAFAWLGETDQAFEWLEKAFQSRDEELHKILTNEYLSRLENDSRYPFFLKKMGLFEAWIAMGERERFASNDS